MPNIDVVVSDTNVFVFLILSNTFEKAFHKSRVTVVVPNAVIEEIKNGLVSWKYPAVKIDFERTLYSPVEECEVDLSELKIDQISSDAAVEYYDELNEVAELGKGEIECICLSKEFGHKFISDDEGAIQECMAQSLNHSYFTEFIESIRIQGVLTQEECESIEKIMKD